MAADLAGLELSATVPPACCTHPLDLLAPEALKFAIHGVKSLSVFWTLRSVSKSTMYLKIAYTKQKRGPSQGKTAILIHIRVFSSQLFMVKFYTNYEK